MGNESAIPVGIKEWTAGKILSLVPKSLIQLLIGLILNNEIGNFQTEQLSNGMSLFFKKNDLQRVQEVELIKQLVGHVSNNNHNNNNKPKPNEPTLQNDLEAMKNALTKLAGGDSSPTTPIIDDNPLLKPEFLNRNHNNNSNNNNNKTS